MGVSTSFWAGPLPHDSNRRRALANELAQQAAARFGDAFLAAAAYGSFARGTDLPFSDLELFVLIAAAQEETYEEWVWGEGRVELNVIGWENALEMAAEVDQDWPLARGQFLFATPLAGDAARIEELKRVSLAQPSEAFHHAMREILLNELYENLGKLRNARRMGTGDGVAAIACEFAHWTAMLIALAHRHCFRGSAGLLREALAMPDPPVGLEPLFGMVAAGRLSDLDEVAEAVENCWRGLEPWAERHGVSTDELLAPPPAGDAAPEALPPSGPT